MKRTSIALTGTAVLACLLLFFTGCDNEDDPVNNDDIYTISTTMNSQNEVPVNASTGTGTTSGTYNATTNTLNYTITWSGLTGQATVGHFHGPAVAGANASPIIHFNLLHGTPNTGGSANGTVQLTDAQETDLLAGKWYTNIHTATNSGGEIRGQVAATK